MSKQEINELITYHFTEFGVKFVNIIIIFGSIHIICILAVLGYMAYFEQICIGILILLLLPSFIMFVILVKFCLNLNEQNKKIIKIIKDDKKSKLITKDTWEKIPKKFLEKKELK